jgi:hypothetical protein
VEEPIKEINGLIANLRARLGDSLGTGPDKAEPASLGYAVIETDADGNNPTYCVHGPDPVDTDYGCAYDQWNWLKDRQGRHYTICKLVPVEPVEPEGDPEDRMPFDWARTDQKITDGRLTDPAWVEIHEASKKVRQRFGITGTMQDACILPHPYTQADGHPYDKVPHRLEQYCAACGSMSSLIAHSVPYALHTPHVHVPGVGEMEGRCVVCAQRPDARAHQVKGDAS